MARAKFTDLPDGRRICGRCGETKEIIEFPPDARRARGRMGTCRVCYRIRYNAAERKKVEQSPDYQWHLETERLRREYREGRKFPGTAIRIVHDPSGDFEGRVFPMSESFLISVQQEYIPNGLRFVQRDIMYEVWGSRIIEIGAAQP